MSDGGVDKATIDDAIIDYLSKKVIVDQTEKLALARISSKTRISIDQVEMGIKRLSAKNLVRRVYLHGKVGFELTPKGKTAIETVAKAEADRITRQLQEAIQQERKTKLRLSTVNKMKALENEWLNYRIPDRKFVDEIEQEATKCLSETNDIGTLRPFCDRDPENYDNSFTKYKPQVEKLSIQNNSLSKAVNNYVKIKNNLLSISVDIQSINKTIKRYESVPEASTQVGELKATVSRLELVQSQLQTFDEDQLSRFENLKTQLEENYRLLEVLRKPTHDFSPVKREIILENAIRYPDPEVSTIYDRNTTGYPLLEKCSKCGITRRSTPVDIG